MFIKYLMLIIGLAGIVAAILIFSGKLKLSKKFAFPSFIIGFILFATSFGVYYIPAKHSGHVNLKIGAPLQSGELIARNGQRGEQAVLLPPGFGYNWKYPLFMDIENVPELNVNSGEIVILKARDGAINPKIVAPKWGDDVEPKKMIEDFDYFMNNGGTRGIQQFIVTTGSYRINKFQWTAQTHRMTNVQSNEVLVIESIFGKSPAFQKTSDDEILSVPLVESDEYRGIVDSAYASGNYPIHPNTQKGHKVPINLQTFIYGGGYVSKIMDLKIDAENDKLITSEDTVTKEPEVNGSAFAAKTKDNHTVYIDVRVLGQIEPVQAPRFIGTIKDINLLDDKIIEPYTKNILTNIVLGYDALELKNKKEELGNKLSLALRDRTQKTGFRTKTVEITNIDIPPIVLIPGKIKSASMALKNALIEKEIAVEQAIKVRNMQDQADNQVELAKATVGNQAATENSAKIKKLADANFYKETKEADAVKYRMAQQALAIQEIKNVIGQDNAAAFFLQDKINEAADKFKVPQTLFISGNGGGADSNSIVSAHLISKSIRDAVGVKTTTNQ